MADKKLAPEATREAIAKADEEFKIKMSEGETTPQEDLDIFALMKGGMRLTRDFKVGRDLIFRISSLGTDHSLIARRMSTVMNPDHDPNDPNSAPTMIDHHRLNSYHLSIAVQQIIYKNEIDNSYPNLPDKVPEDPADIQNYLTNLEARKEYLESMLPGIYDRAIQHLTELAEEVERLSSPESLEDF